MKNEFDVVVIGGGTTGTAVIRDLAMRGFHKSILLDRDDWLPARRVLAIPLCMPVHVM